MKVLHVVWEGRWSGPPARVLSLAPYLAAEGVESVLALPDEGAGWVREADQAACTIEALPLRRLRRTRSPGVQLGWAARFYQGVALIERVIESHSIDLVHSYGLVNVQGVVAARRQARPVVWHLNDMLAPKWLRLASSRVLRRWPDAVVADGPRVAEAYGLDPANLPGVGAIIFPTYDERRFHPDVQPGAGLRRSWGWPKGSVIACTVGNLNPAKGYAHLMDAFVEATQRDDRLRLVVVGAVLDGREEIKRAAVRRVRAAGVEDRVRFLGLRMDVPQILAAADLYVQASVSETGPATVLEAGAVGLPVVATNVGSVPEMLEPDVTGLIVAAANPRELADALVRLTHDAGLRLRMGAAAPEIVRSGFGPTTSARSMAALYREVLMRRDR